MPPGVAHVSSDTEGLLRVTSKSFFGMFGLDAEQRADHLYRRGQLAKAAELFYKAGQHGQAAAVYAEDGNFDRAVAIFREANQPRQAAELLMRQGQRRDAIPLFEEAGAYRQAAEVCLALHQHVRAARVFEKADLFHDAAESFAKAGEVEQALAAWERESEQLKRQGQAEGDQVVSARLRELDLHRADILARFGRPAEAASILMALDRPRRAAPLFERAGAFAEAARAHLAAGQLANAKALVEREDAVEGSQAISKDLRLEILLSCGQDAEAGVLLETLGRFEEAAAAFEDAMEWGKAAQLWEKAELMERAAELYFRVERYEESGRCFARANEHDKAGKAFALVGNHQAAGDAYLAADAYLQAGEHYLKAGDRIAAQDALQQVASNDTEYARACLLLIPLLLDQGLAEGAKHRLASLEQTASVDLISAASRFYWHGRVQEEIGDLSGAEVAYQKVLSERTGFRDTQRRLGRLRDRLTPASVETPPAQGTETTAVLIETGVVTSTPVVTRPKRDEASASRGGGDTQAVASEVSSKAAASTVVPEPAPTPPPETEVMDTAASRLVQDLESVVAGLPFEVERWQDPWWPGSAVIDVRSYRSKSPGLLLAFPLDVLGDPAALFRREAARIQALDHPSILTLEEDVLTEDHGVLLYESFAGRPLAHHLRGPWRPLPTSALNLLVQVCEGVAAAHQLGVGHEWLSPKTVLIDDDEHVRLAGFGLRHLLPTDDATAAAYLPPELQDGLLAGPAGDIYSFGLLGVELLGALLPADWTSADTISTKTVQWPDGLKDVVPESIRDALLRCLARNPLERPSAEGLKSTLSVLGLVPGQVLQARYEILGELGRGGMSRVYRAHDKMMDEQVAIKTVLSPVLGHVPEEKRLLREVRICRKISHPNVVRVHDLGNFPGGVFVTMELLDGEGLDVLIRREAPLPLVRVRDIIRQVAKALGEAHRVDVVHRDLKPANVILVGDRVKVLDFGIARMGEAQVRMTQTGEVVGSPLYMSPEQIQGKALDGTCDLYALGVITYTLLAGREPFVGDTPTAVVYQHLRDAPPDILRFHADLPKPWVAFLDRLLAKKSRDRFADAATTVTAIDALPT